MFKNKGILKKLFIFKIVLKSNKVWGQIYFHLRKLKAEVYKYLSPHFNSIVSYYLRAFLRHPVK